MGGPRLDPLLRFLAPGAPGEGHRDTYYTWLRVRAFDKLHMGLKGSRASYSYVLGHIPEFNFATLRCLLHALLSYNRTGMSHAPSPGPTIQ